MLDKLFRPRPADGMVLVLGLGRFGIACARRLQELGMDVLGVDADLDLVEVAPNAKPPVRLSTWLQP